MTPPSPPTARDATADDLNWHTTTHDPPLLMLVKAYTALAAVWTGLATLAHPLFVDDVAADATAAVSTSADAVAGWAASNLEIAAPAVALVAAWTLYGALGKRLLGADDDFWPRLRRPVLRALDTVARRHDGLYAVTTTRSREIAGHAHCDVDALERRLEAAGYLRQPLSSLHCTPDGDPEAGSWARPLAPWLPVEPLVRALPVAGGPLGRFVRAADDVLAWRQRNVVLHVVGSTDDGTDIVAVAGHDEPNPLNPLTALAHYRGDRWEPAPDATRRDLKRVGVELSNAGDAPFSVADGTAD